MFLDICADCDEYAPVIILSPGITGTDSGRGHESARHALQLLALLRRAVSRLPGDDGLRARLESNSDRRKSVTALRVALPQDRGLSDQGLVNANSSKLAQLLYKI